MDHSPFPGDLPAKPKPKAYVPALGPRMKALLFVLFAAAGLLGASGIYLGLVSVLDWARKPLLYTNSFTFWVLLFHVVVGVIALAPLFVFGLIHLITAWKRTNRAAVRLGVLLLIAVILVMLSGVAVIQLDGLPQLPTGSLSRNFALALHVILPVAAVALYVWHRKKGPKIRWRWGYAWIGVTAAFTVGAILAHGVDPRYLTATAPKEGEKYFHPSEARTANGNFIPANVLMMDTYCQKCHPDVYNDHFHSAHRFSSFNNPPYLFSVRETRKVATARDGNVQASRWCAGCHDPVPFFSGVFEDPRTDPKFDAVRDADRLQRFLEVEDVISGKNMTLESPQGGARIAHAGITCTSCHAITHVHGPLGNAAFTIEEPPHYPFAFSDNPILQWVNNQLIKARPDFHKQTFLKPVHKSAEFCSTCHKVALPVGVTNYKDFLRGQNHYDSFLLSGVSGHGSRSFYYPPRAKQNCAECHMPTQPSNDFAARDFDGDGVRKRHSHLFPGANTGLPFLLMRDPRYSEHAAGFQKAIDTHSEFLKDQKLRIDLFGLKEGGGTDPKTLIAPLRPNLPTLKPGQKYLVEVVLRTLNVGHHFSQGTADSNEIWVDFKATSGGKELARNGALRDEEGQAGPVDEWSNFINVLMLDRDGKRINRRNPQDIFTPLYDKQIPPGAAQVIHYRLDVPTNVTGPIDLHVRLRYRKFDYEYMKLVHEGKEPPALPIVDMCEDRVTLPVEGGPAVAEAKSSIPEWQRWNDYGIGNLLEGGAGAKRGHFRQAEEAFKTMLTLGVPDAMPHAHVNLARVYIDEGRLDEAARELEAAANGEKFADWWTLAWFTALVNSETATKKEDLDSVITDLGHLVNPKRQPSERGFDFSLDYVVLNRLANRLFKRSQFEEDGSEEQRQLLLRAVTEAERVLILDPEDVEAHDLLMRSYGRLSQGFVLPQALNVVGDPGELRSHANMLTNGKRTADERFIAAGLLQHILEQVAQGSPRPDQPRLPVYRDLIKQLHAAYHNEPDRNVQAALASVLAVLHRESHAAFKPDENARALASQEYRKAHPAANHAARDRVIYPTTKEQRERILTTGNLD